jgi:hypothetical protein
MAETPQFVTVVLELHDNMTANKLMELYQNSTYVEGATIHAVYEGNLPELLNECEHNYNEMIMQEVITPCE